MPGKRHSPEQILRKLREVEVALARGETVSQTDSGNRAGLLPLAKRVRWSFDRPGQETQETRTGECKTQAGGWRSHSRQVNPERSGQGKLLGPARRRKCVDHVRQVLDVHERRACRVLGQPRATRRLQPRIPDDHDLLTRKGLRPEQILDKLRAVSLSWHFCLPSKRPVYDLSTGYL